MSLLNLLKFKNHTLQEAAKFLNCETDIPVLNS